MKNEKILHFAAVFAAFLVFHANAGFVTPETARAVANAWAQENAAFGAGQTATTIRTICDTNAAKTVLWYQVSLAGGGALMVSPAEEIEPVVMALEKDPGDLPAAHPLRAILTADMRSRLRFLGLYTEDAASTTSGGTKMSAAGLSGAALTAAQLNAAQVAEEWGDEQKAKWARLKSKAGLSESGLKKAFDLSIEIDDSDAIAVEACVVKGFEPTSASDPTKGMFTHWNQSEAGGGVCFNYYTPNHSVCGCVATAFGAVLQYFGTEEGQVITTNCSYEGVSADYTSKGGTYDWKILPKNWGGTNEVADVLTEEQRELLGRVAYDCGVAVHMDWAEDGSGVSASAMAKYIAVGMYLQFGYSAAHPFNSKGSSFDKTGLTKLIYTQNRCGAPVIMGILGHAVVAVGYGKDSDGVDRTRVFMGWGGYGDGWYALPTVDTKSTEAGSTYTSEIVNSVVTMIGYKDDQVVPVCGTCDRVGSHVQLLGVSDTGEDGVESNRVVTVNGYGYWGTRVSPSCVSNGLVVLEKPTKNFYFEPFQAGEGAAEGSTVKDDWSAKMADLKLDLETALEYIPGPTSLSLMNAQVAQSTIEAKTKALAANKAILAVSGTIGDTKTQFVIDYLYNLDDNHFLEDDFIYLFLDCSSEDADGNPSIAVFDPYTYYPSARWGASNGRLSYQTFSGIPEDEDDPYTNANVVAQATLDVLVTGATTYARLHDGVELDVANYAVYRGCESDVTDTAFSNRTDIAGFGEFTESFYEGEKVVMSVPSAVTNEDDGVVWECIGWTTNAIEDALAVFETGEAAEERYFLGNSATLTLSAAEATCVTWLWSDAAYRVRTWGKLKSVGNLRTDLTTPVEGWYPRLSRITVTAQPTVQEGFNTYQYSYATCGTPDGADWESVASPYDDTAILSDLGNFEDNGNTFSFTLENGADVVMYYKKGSQAAEAQKYGLLWECKPAELTNCVQALVGAQQLVANGVTNYLATQNARVVIPGGVVDEAGAMWQCTNALINGEAAQVEYIVGSDGSFFVACPVTLQAGEAPCVTFEWAQVTSTKWSEFNVVELPQGEPPPMAFKAISLNDAGDAWNITLTNAVQGYTYTLLTSDDVAGEFKVDTTSTPVTPLVATEDGPITFTVPKTGNTQFWRATAK